MCGAIEPIPNKEACCLSCVIIVRRAILAKQIGDSFTNALVMKNVWQKGWHRWHDDPNFIECHGPTPCGDTGDEAECACGCSGYDESCDFYYFDVNKIGESLTKALVCI